jgi:hypothetical protein
MCTLLWWHPPGRAEMLSHRVPGNRCVPAQVALAGSLLQPLRRSLRGSLLQQNDADHAETE